jgi:hypothetical protein
LVFSDIDSGEVQLRMCIGDVNCHITGAKFVTFFEENQRCCKLSEKISY